MSYKNFPASYIWQQWTFCISSTATHHQLLYWREKVTVYASKFSAAVSEVGNKSCYLFTTILFCYMKLQKNIGNYW